MSVDSMELLGLRTVWNCFVYGHFFFLIVLELLCLWTKCGVTTLFMDRVWNMFVVVWGFVLFLTLWNCSNRGEKE